MSRRPSITTTLAAALGSLLVLGCVAVSLSMRSQSPLAVTSFTILSEKDQPQDLDARRLVTRDLGVDVSHGKYLGHAEDMTFLLAADADEGLGLVRIGPGRTQAASCSAPEEVEASGLTVQFGHDDTAYLAIVAPDDYREATISTENEVVLTEPNLVVVRGDSHDRLGIVLSAASTPDLTAPRMR